MFLKPFKLKSNTTLKGSEIKKLLQCLRNAFPNILFDQIITVKSHVNLLKLITHDNITTTVYCVEKLPMFFENVDGQLVPTLYSLWKIDDFIPYFTTYNCVLPNLYNGADLFVPGVVPQGKNLYLYGNYKKGQLVAINLTTNKAAVGVGVLARSSEDLYMSGGHGIAVKILHIFGDKLWGLEPNLAQQIPEANTKPLQQSDFPALGSENQKNTTSTANTDSSVNLKTEISENTQKTDSCQEETDCSSIVRNVQETDSSSIINNLADLHLSTNNATSNENESSIETILKEAFLRALKNNGPSLQLPLLTSNFYRLYVVPEASIALDIKKTKYKKLSNFLNEMSNEGFIVVKEESKGIDKIVSIDLKHPQLVDFIVDYKKPESEEDDGQLFHSKLVESYTVTDQTAPLFTKLNYKRGEDIPLNQIKTILREYINTQHLTVSTKKTATQPTLYNLDAVLTEICDSPTATLSEINVAVISKMQRNYKMCIMKDPSNNKPSIQMTLATRSGNKKVTLISNIECHGIIVSKFMQLCKKGAAASTTIVSSPNQKRDLLQIQGNQIRFVYNLLTEVYKIPPKQILGLDLAKKEKKQKKK